MKRRFVKAVLAAALAAAAMLGGSRPARAQEIQVTGPLKGAPAVRHLRYYRKGRFEFAPTASFTLLDEYRRTLLVGAKLNYFITDWLGIGVWGAGGIWSETTSLTNQIDNVAPRNVETVINVNHTGGVPPSAGAAPSSIGTSSAQSFANQTAKLSYVIAPQATFTPFRGKLAIFNKIFVDTDLSLAAGVAIVGIQERSYCGGGGNELACFAPQSFALAGQTKFTWTFGVGLTFWPSNLVSFGIEYRALPFYWNPAGFDTRGSGPNGNYPDNQVNSQDDTFHFNQIVTLAVGFSFPSPKISD